MSKVKENRKRMLVTGGSGTHGYNILKQLAAQDRYTIIAPIRTRHSWLAGLEDRVDFLEHELSDAMLSYIGSIRKMCRFQAEEVLAEKTRSP